ncbi:MAG: serine/threonine protein kinase [Myxococcales bacterium]|nr:serine/threonine protein kinase [Myxococcales bacterium]
MKNSHLQPDLLFCRQCRRHFRGKRRECPTDGSELELVTAFLGQAGDELDERYVLIEQIGVGGMGTVFLAHDRLAERDVALKLLRAEYASNASSAQRFFQEAKLLRQIHHAAVVGLHRFSRTADGMLLIDMELVQGESVRDRILTMRQGFDCLSAMIILDHLLAALAACHDVGVIHCDVKPENFMLPRGGIVPGKLIDFGVAQAAGPVVQCNDVGVIGTPAYMSPEQVRGGPVDARTDLYLVGCVTYELLTGEPPFTSQSPLELCQDQMLSAPPPLTSRMSSDLIPAGFEAWLMPMLAKDPNQRPNSARLVREQLRVIRHEVRRQVEEERRTPVRPPSATLLRRDMPSSEPTAQPAPRNEWMVESVRALVEVRQQNSSTGMTYGPEAIEQILRHVLAGPLAELRDIGAEIGGPVGPHVDIRLACNGDERGTISHLLDTLAAISAHLSRIPEPKLEMRAAVVADLPGNGLTFVPALDPLALMDLSPLTQVRVDEHVAKWAGRRALVKLTSLCSGPESQTVIYAASLNAA